MLFKIIIYRLRLFSLALLTICLPAAVNAQISPDGSTSTTVTNEGNNTTIEAGDRTGGNLFHSFSDFSIPTGTEASFNNAEDVSNIINRVTGGNISNIDGVLRANGGANVFLINPAGIIFGANARLDIGGSFLGSSANSILFPDDEEFSADNQNSPILTVNAPIGLGFRDNPGDIAVNGSALEVPNGETFGLIGGNVRIAGSQNGIISAIGGRVELGGLTEAGEIAIAPFDTASSQIGSLSFPEAVARGNVTLNNFAFVTTAGSNGGDIAINARNITLEGGELGDSQIFAGIAEAGVENARSGDIKLNATENINITEDSQIINRMLVGTSGSVGNIEISTTQLNLDSGFIFINLLGEGNTGAIEINASDRVFLVGRSTIENGINFEGIGDTGGVEINTNSLEITGSSFIGARNAGQGNAGDILFNTSDFILGNRSIISSEALENSVGDAANINIDANTVRIIEETEITTSTTAIGTGKAGNISISASESILFDNDSVLKSETLETAAGDSGNINLNTPLLTIQGESILSTESFGKGSSGNIAINSSNIDLSDSSLLTTKSGFNSLGNAGTVDITTTNLNINNGAAIISDTASEEDAGNINIQASDNITVDNAVIQSKVLVDGFFEEETDGDRSLIKTLAGGDGGDISISTGNLSLVNGGQILTDTNASGDAGNIQIDASDTVNLSEAEGNIQSAISSSVIRGDALIDTVTGNAGNIQIDTSNLIVSGGAFITSNSFGEGDASDIMIEADNVSIDNGSIESLVEGVGIGNGGDIFVTANSLDLNNQAVISAANEPVEASEESFNGGNVDLQIEDNLVLRDGSKITAFAGENANGGNIDIDAGFVIAFPDRNNDIVANAEQGLGGNIDISSRAILGLTEQSSIPDNNTNDIDASSQFGSDGNVSIDNLDNSLTQGVTELPDAVIEPQTFTYGACGGGRGIVNYILAGKGGVPPAPELPIQSFVINVGDEYQLGFESGDDLDNIMRSPAQQVIPAQGVMVADNGDILLTARPASNGDRRINTEYDGCN